MQIVKAPDEIFKRIEMRRDILSVDSPLQRAIHCFLEHSVKFISGKKCALWIDARKKMNMKTTSFF